MSSRPSSAAGIAAFPAPRAARAGASGGTAEETRRVALHDIPHTFVWARESGDLAEALKGLPPDVIVGETVSNRADGFRLMEAVKASPGTAETPVVLLNRESGLDSLYATYSAMNKATRQQSTMAPAPDPTQLEGE